MFSLVLLLILSALAGTTVSAKRHAHGTTKDGTTKDGTTKDACTFTDAASAIREKGNCKVITLSNVNVPARQTLDLSRLKDNTRVIFSEETTFEYAEWAGPLISFSGNSISIEGAPGHIIDCNGKRWWDSKGTNGGKQKPKFFFANSLHNSTIKSLNVRNTPAQAFSIASVTNLSIYDVTVDDRDGDKFGGHNTDGFDISASSDVYISGAKVWNQDDCMAVNSGHNITFTNGDCDRGHGIAIGSVGGRTKNDVSNVRVLNSHVSNSENGIRIKTVYGARGSVSNVVFDTITLSDITVNGIVIRQDYKNGGPTGRPTPYVPITGLTVKNVVGTVREGGTNVLIKCAACSQWTWEDNKITGGSNTPSQSGVPLEVTL
ncbi:hypothetical protein C2857_004819 [Epichloe festucae Fl1]|uniref:endo-polygalacturonase n=1 Tax=Epichloe festucae (strain Fl1) TaxID=877507 RepID=A0A7S9KV31_EPIFF|nr:hypothetical protein C2857_004819 [Epichloe festucae Fl1]